jgi:glycosyltransferase involved in cell wall biosynthesis
MKIALVHDYLTQDGGAERVLRAMHRMWPDAPIFVLAHDREAVEGFTDALVRESFLAKLPFGRKKYHWYLPLMPFATERHNLHGFDVVLSSSSAFAKGVLTRPETLHISYCHTPARFLWTDTHEYIAGLRKGFFVKTALPRLVHKLRLWDSLSTNRVDTFIANSETIQRRIRKYYRRESTVIYPPVSITLPQKKSVEKKYFVAGGRLVGYKRLDIVIKAFNRLHVPLVIFGTGPEHKRLRRLARPHIQFVGRITDQKKAELLAGAEAYIHPQIEDFGITALESMAVGRPVIAYRAGGALETVIEGKTGIFFDMQNWESLLHAVIHFNAHVWDTEELQAHAERFSEIHFATNLRQFVEEAFRKHQNLIP